MARLSKVERRPVGAAGLAVLESEPCAVQGASPDEETALRVHAGDDDSVDLVCAAEQQPGRSTRHHLRGDRREIGRRWPAPHGASASGALVHYGKPGKGL
ncbi:hypothetical protein GCM10010211_41030 [Streptomyces albospinus]|uniref:Uncharacterized protein n=1 Tax=Streptomyces albospinus TaxID=285515 RepID=A0ABQ2V719_9ACTN|nr:hypothetical protein [Streptomyces albospinus]GGU71089.1 hypothetical protein GCM10010211_41030 [Streptomyces albospinus]